MFPTVYAYRPDGKTLYFKQVNGQFVADADVADRLVQLVDGSGNITGWKYTNAANDEVETYNASGTLTSLTSRSGLTQTLAYNSGGQLATVADAFGRTLSLAYDTSGRLATLTDPAGGTYTYAYTSVNDVSSVTGPEGTVRTYLYNEAADLPVNSNQPYVLTGIVDESNTRFATFQYDYSIRTLHYGLCRLWCVDVV
jgi:YD repeat-containing protein